MRYIWGLLIIFILQAFTMQNDFLTEQKRYKRVRHAIEVKGNIVEAALKNQGLSINNYDLLMVSYKVEQELELYVKPKNETTYTKLKTFNICQRSGGPGPKRKQGDLQVPEGFYHIDRFNPASNFYLSLGLNYPNKADRIKSTANNLGGDIFIHGACVTIGCMPMTDDKIMEIYLYAVYAKNNGQSKIPVYSFPFRMTERNMETYTLAYKHRSNLIQFWNNLKIGYDAFTECPSELTIGVTNQGDYTFKK